MILDTNALSAWQDDDPVLLQLLQAQERLLLPVIVIGEYRYGALRSRRRRELESWLDVVVTRLDLGPVVLATALLYGDVRAVLHDKGRPIPENDMWIAALALQHRLPVLSRDTHFDVVDGLRRVPW